MFVTTGADINSKLIAPEISQPSGAERLAYRIVVFVMFAVVIGEFLLFASSKLL